MKRKAVGVITLSLFALTACGSSGSDSAVDPAAGAPQGSLGSSVHMGGSLVTTYNSLRQLLTDSTAVVIVEVPASAESKESSDTGLPTTDTTVNVDKTLWGSIGDSQSIVVHQLGGAGVESDDFSPLLSSGDRYLLFVAPFELSPGTSTGSFVITGDSGEFSVMPDGSFKSDSPAVGESFPSNVSREALDSALQEVVAPK